MMVGDEWNGIGIMEGADDDDININTCNYNEQLQLISIENRCK